MINIDNVLRITNGTLELNSGLSEQEFARSRLAQYMNEEGLLCKPLSEDSCTAGTQGGASFTIETFRFTGTAVKDGTVILTAPGFKGRPLLSFIQSAMSKPSAAVKGAPSSDTDKTCAEKIAALKALDTAYRAVRECEKYRALRTQNENTEAHIAVHGKSAHSLHNCGPLSILYAEDGSVLFLPPSLFERSMLARSGQERASLYGFWVRGGTSETESFAFSFAACTYAVLTGQPPFPAANDEARIEDYTDDNFIPLSFLFPHIADNDAGRSFKALMQAMDAALSSVQVRRTSIQIKREGELFLPSLIVSEAAFAQKPFMPLQLPPSKADKAGIYKPEVKPEASAEDKALVSFMHSQQKRIHRRRFMRRHGGKLAIGAGVFVLIAAAIFSIVKTNMERPTTKGMTPVEVVHTFYTALHELDTLTLDSCGERKAIKTYSNMAASLFVTGKMRQAYERKPDFLPPEQWIDLKNPLDFWVFGLTHLTIESEDAAAYMQDAQKGDTVQVTACFYILTEEGQHNYRAAAYTDRLILTYGKKYWQITRLDSESEDVDFDTELFIQRLGSDDIQKIKNDYLWLP